MLGLRFHVIHGLGLLWRSSLGIEFGKTGFRFCLFRLYGVRLGFKVHVVYGLGLMWSFSD